MNGNRITVLAVYAAANRGKSSMLKMVVENLNPDLEMSDRHRFVFELNKHKVGIALDGDYEESVLENLQYFLQEGCELLVIPTHVKDRTVVVTNEFVSMHTAELIWIKKAELSQELNLSGFDDINRLEAGYLSDYIRNLLSAN